MHFATIFLLVLAVAGVLAMFFVYRSARSGGIRHATARRTRRQTTDKPHRT